MAWSEALTGTVERRSVENLVELGELRWSSLDDAIYKLRKRIGSGRGGGGRLLRQGGRGKDRWCSSQDRRGRRRLLWRDGRGGGGGVIRCRLTLHSGMPRTEKASRLVARGGDSLASQCVVADIGRGGENSGDDGQRIGTLRDGVGKKTLRSIDSPRSSYTGGVNDGKRTIAPRSQSIQHV